MRSISPQHSGTRVNTTIDFLLRPPVHDATAVFQCRHASVFSYGTSRNLPPTFGTQRVCGS